jgi:hypothetical protein
MKRSSFGTMCGGTLLLGCVLVVLLGVGWMMNCYKFTQLDFKSPVKAEVLRGIGLFPPIGAVMGWISIDDTPCRNRPPVARFKVTPVE